MSNAPVVDYVIVATCAVLPYWPMFFGEWEYLHYDDKANYERNQYIQTYSWANLAWLWADGVVLGVYEPAALSFKMVVFSMIGNSATTVARVSAALHGLNAMGAYALCRALLLKFGVISSDSITLRQRKSMMLATVLVGVHPLRVQTVAWLSCLPYLLACLFACVALLCFCRPSPVLYTCAIVAYTLCSCSKAAGKFCSETSFVAVR